jgi:hypothetical protein
MSPVNLSSTYLAFAGSLLKNFLNFPYNITHQQGNKVYKYKLWVRINDYQTANTYVWANSDYEAKLLGEAQYGVGNVLNYTRED